MHSTQTRELTVNDVFFFHFSVKLNWMVTWPYVWIWVSEQANLSGSIVFKFSSKRQWIQFENNNNNKKRVQLNTKCKIAFANHQGKRKVVLTPRCHCFNFDEARACASFGSFFLLLLFSFVVTIRTWQAERNWIAFRHFLFLTYLCATYWASCVLFLLLVSYTLIVTFTMW